MCKMKKKMQNILMIHNKIFFLFRLFNLKKKKKKKQSESKLMGQWATAFTVCCYIQLVIKVCIQQAIPSLTVSTNF